MLKFTERVSGRKRATFNVPFHVGGVEMVQILCRFEAAGYSFSVGTKFNRKEWDKLVRELVREYGQDAWESNDWREYHTEPELVGLFTWALGEVDRCFPEASDDALDELRDEIEKMAKRTKGEPA